MLPSLRDVLRLPAIAAADPLVRTAPDRLDRPVRWVHVSEVTDIAGLLEGGELILTTGIALPRSTRELRRYVRELSSVGVTGLAVELGRRYRGTLPDQLVEAAEEVELPLIELRRETPFVAMTQAVHTLILDARMRELLASDERQTHRTLLTVLALSPELPPHAAERSAALGVPLTGRALTGVVVRSTGDTAAPALLRDLANTAADSLGAAGIPALVGPLDDTRIAGLLAPDRGPERTVRGGRPDRVEAALDALAGDLHDLAAGRHGVDVVIGVGSTLAGIEQAHTTLREAMQVGDTAAGLTPRAGWFRSSDLRLHGLAYSLRESEHVRDYVQRQLGALTAGDGLYEVLVEYCRAGGNKTAAAGRLYISRPALYDRVRKLEQLLEVDLDDPQVVLALHFAVLVRQAAQRPDLGVRSHLPESGRPRLP